MPGAKEEKTSRLERAEGSVDAALERLLGRSHGITSRIGRIIAITVKVLLYGLILVAIAAVIIIPVRLYVTGTGGVFLDQVRVAVGNTPLAAITFKGFAAAFEVLWNPQKFVEPGGAFSFQEKQQEVEQYGVTISDFKPDGFFEVGEPVSATAKVNIKAPPDYDLEVDFAKACSMDNYDGRVDVSGPFSQDKKVKVDSGSERTVGITCEFLDGVKDLERDVQSRVINFRPIYEMHQDILWRVFSKDTNEGEKQRVSEAISKGPMVISLFSLDGQPFYTGINYRMSLGLKNNKEIWGGGLDIIKRIELILPDNIRLELGQFCAFEESGNSEGYINYAIKSKSIEQANYDCNALDFLLARHITRDDCIANYKEDLQYSCRFKYNSAESVLAEQQFRAIVTYTYRGETRAVLTLSKKP